jgi:hypothetical protein
MAKRYTLIRDRIISKIQSAVTSTVPEMVVLTAPTLEFQAYPAAYIVPQEGESDWETNTMDERAYPFQINVYYETKQSGVSNALDALMNLVDDILDAFAQDKQMAITTPSLQTQLSNAGYTNDVVMSVSPVAAGWGEITERNLLVATIKITVNLAIPNQ